jgi:two-component system chemotaxis sensor kinase CheA
MDELTREFLIESQEGLDRMERCLTDLEERPKDAGLIGEIFRSVHTIKGTTGFLGFKRLEKLAHAGENLLSLLREDKLIADTSIITGLLQLLDGLRSILKTIETEESEGDGEDVELIIRLKELQAPESTQAPVQARQPAYATAAAQFMPEAPLSPSTATPPVATSPAEPAAQAPNRLAGCCGSGRRPCRQSAGGERRCQTARPGWLCR